MTIIGRIRPPRRPPEVALTAGSEGEGSPVCLREAAKVETRHTGRNGANYVRAFLIRTSGSMNLADYDYGLPEELIAQYPASERDGARLMVLDRKTGRIDHTVFRSFPDFLRPGDCLVVNETRVFPARLNGYRPGTRGAVELLLVRCKGDCWEVFARPGRRLREGAEVAFPDVDLVAEVTAVLPSGRRMVRFKGSASLESVLESQGRIPLPPYIRRGEDPTDRERYQSVYARTRGAVAAPTAGLHFTSDLLDRIRASGVEIVPVLLHVGPGTFKPVEVEDPPAARIGCGVL